jgi:hypothetical protein
MNKKSILKYVLAYSFFVVGFAGIGQTDGGGVNCPSGSKYVCARDVDGSGNTHTIWKGFGETIVVSPQR